MLTQRTSIAGANAGARTVAPRTALQTACRTRYRRCATNNRRTSAVASAGRRAAVSVYATSQLQALGTSLIQKAAKAASPGIFIAGAEGQIALRLLKDLAIAGEKVTAGVADVDRAQSALQFAKKYEVIDSDSLRNIKLIELDYSDVESLASTIPRRGKLVIVDGDVIAGGNQADKLPAVLAAAAEAEATPIIITSGPSAARGGKSGGGLFAFGGRADGRGRVASIADKVGLDDYVIIQASGLDPSGPLASPRNLVVAESGTFDPATAGPVGLSDVYDVLTAVLAAPRLPGGPVSLSVAGTGVDVGDVRGQLAAALSTIGERNASEAAARKGAEEPAAGIFGFGSRQSAVKEPEVEEEEEEAPARPSLFGFGGTRRISKPAAAPEEEEEEERPAAKPVGMFGFGTKKAQVRVEEEEEEEERPRAKSPLSLFGFGAKPVQAAEEEEEEEEEEASPIRPASPFSLFGGGAQKKQQLAEPEDEEEQVSAGPFSFGTRRIKARAQQSGKVQELTPAQKAAQARAEAAEETKRRQEEARAQAEALRERRQKEAAEARAAALEAQRRKQEEARTAGAQAQRKREEEAQRRKQQDTRAAAARQQQEGRAAAAEAARRKQEEARAAADAKRKQQEQSRAQAAEAARRKQEEARAAAAAEAARKKQQDEARARAEAAAKAREDQRRKQEEARAAAAEAARKKQEEARAQAEAKAKAKAEDQKRRAEELKRKQAEAAKARAKAGTGTTTRPGTPVGRTGTAKAGTQKPGTQPVKQATQVKRPIKKSSSSSKEQDKNDSRGMITYGPRRR